jgi:LmbE family N-acetylglucosaminyl deacetylase
MSLGRIARRLFWLVLERRAPEWVPEDVTGLTVVFSPHYDDETLGAGAAILKLRKLGAPVRIVFMTDGSQSHATAMPGAELAKLRRREGQRAAAALGIDPANLTFLEYPETRLAALRDDAASRVAELLAGWDFRRVFVPSRQEPDLWSLDHRATTEIVYEALARSGRECEVLEYLIWFWYHWPWVPILGTGDARQIARLSWRNAFGLKAFAAANTSVEVSPFRSRKQDALEQHRTQMTRLRRDLPWPVLGEVGRGEFLENFFRSREWFRASRWKGAGDAA